MNKTLLSAAILSSMLLTGCVSSGTSSSSEIGMARGQNASLVSDAEYAQYQRQRANEVYEAEAQAAKNKASMGNIREGIQAGKEGMQLIRDIKNIFGM